MQILAFLSLPANNFIHDSLFPTLRFIKWVLLTRYYHSLLLITYCVMLSENDILKQKAVKKSYLPPLYEYTS